MVSKEHQEDAVCNGNLRELAHGSDWLMIVQDRLDVTGKKETKAGYVSGQRYGQIHKAVWSISSQAFHIQSGAYNQLQTPQDLIQNVHFKPGYLHCPFLILNLGFYEFATCFLFKDPLWANCKLSKRVRGISPSPS